jgi:hypothetical protein
MPHTKRVIAVTVIHRTTTPGKPGNRREGIAPTPPTVQIIKPNTVFLAKDRAEYEELLAMGAIRRPEKDETVSVSLDSLPSPEVTPAPASTRQVSSRGRTAKTEVSTSSVSDGSDLV